MRASGFVFLLKLCYTCCARIRPRFVVEASPGKCLSSFDDAFVGCDRGANHVFVKCPQLLLRLETALVKPVLRLTPQRGLQPLHLVLVYLRSIQVWPRLPRPAMLNRGTSSKSSKGPLLVPTDQEAGVKSGLHLGVCKSLCIIQRVSRRTRLVLGRL